MTNQQNKLVIFESKKIRRIWHNDEWFFSVVDIVEVLTDSPYPRQYWEKVKQREFTEFQLSPIWLQLKLGICSQIRVIICKNSLLFGVKKLLTD